MSQDARSGPVRRTAESGRPKRARERGRKVEDARWPGAASTPDEPAHERPRALKRRTKVTSAPAETAPTKTTPTESASARATRGKAARGSARAAKAAKRRAAILDAALEEFSARGFAAARLEDVARRAGVAKGTIYLYFADKETLFQELLRSMMGPVVRALEAVPAVDLPVRTLAARLADLFVHEIYGTRRKDVIRLMIAEGPRFPNLAEFYYHEVLERVVAALRQLIARAVERGEIEHAALARFPQLIAAPGLVAIVWNGLFDRFAPLDVAALMRAHLDIVFGTGSGS